MKFELIEIETLETEQYDGYTYDLEVEEDHSYNIEGVVVHNSVCTTRLQTGVGYPQLSAIIECADAAHGLGGHIIGDGGCTNPGDIAKAFGGGADFVMLGGMFAGHDEGGGKIIEEMHELSLRQPNSHAPEYEIRKFVEFYGMSSDTAMNKHHGGVADYRSSEGRTVRVPYRGPIAETVKNILGGIRSSCALIGADSLKNLSKCTTFVRVTQQFNSVFATYATQR